MFIRQEKKIAADGNTRTYISIIDGYRDSSGQVRQRRIKSYGYLEEHENPDAFLAMVAAELEVFEAEQDNNIQINITRDENRNNAEINKSYNYGYRYLDAIYERLDIASFMHKFQASLGIKVAYNFNDILKFLVFQRILRPGSKRDNIKEINKFYGLDLDFSLDDIYRFLSFFAAAFEPLQAHLRQSVEQIFTPNTERIYYDVTNYYFEIDFNDGEDDYRHKGVSKEHRLDPIIGLSLFIDSDGLPLKFNIFNGNMAESLTLIPELTKVKQTFNVERTIVVADKGINTLQNIAKIIENGDGYLFSQTIRGPKGKRYHEHVLNDEGYTKTFDQAGNIIYKYKIFTEEYELKIDGKPQKLKRKVLIYYNLKDDIKIKNKRFEKIMKAEKSLKNNAYSIDHSYTQYIKKEIVNQKTGEVNDDFKEFRNLNLAKIAKDEKFDGYFCLVTSELNYDHPKMRETYHRLSDLEDTFRVTKTDLSFRPVYHYKKENIQSHFLICYVALLIIRLMQYKLKKDAIELSVERIVTVLNKMNIDIIKSYVHVDYVGGKKDFKQYLTSDNKLTFNNYFDGTDQIEKDYNLIKLSYNTPFDYAYVRIEKFLKYYKNIKFRITSA